jgi:hypothetical protein
MRWINFILATIVLVVTATMAQAGDNESFLYFATHDPFSCPETSPTRNDVYLFGGVFAEESFGEIVRFWDAEYTDNYMFGGVYGRDFRELGAGFVLSAVAGAAIRFGEEDDTSGELWAGVRIRHHGLVIGDVAIAPGFTAGLSVVTAPTEIERLREIHYGGDATFLGFLGPELALRFRQAPNLEFVYQLHHRSGAEGVFGEMGEGSNASILGLRYRFWERGNGDRARPHGEQPNRKRRANTRRFLFKESEAEPLDHADALTGASCRSVSMFRTTDIASVSSAIASSMAWRCFCKRPSCFSDLSSASLSCFVLEPVGS